MSKTKKYGKVALLLAITFSMTVILSGCGGGKPADSDTSKAPTVIKLSIGGAHSKSGAAWVQELSNVFIPEVKQKAAALNYQIEFTEAWAGQVAKSGEDLQAFSDGILDMGYVTLPLFASKLPLHSFNYWLPFGPDDPVMESKATAQMYKDFPALKKAFDDNGQKFLGFTTVQNYGFVTKFNVTSLDDFKGKKIGGTPAMFPYIQSVGGVPVQADMTNMFTNIQSGVMEGMAILPNAIVSAKMYEVANYFFAANMGTVSPHALVINTKTWDKLPKEIQNIIQQASDNFTLMSAKNAKDSTEKDYENWKKNNGKVINITADQKAQWASKFPSSYVLDKTKPLDQKGLPATDLMKAYVKALQGLGYTLPKQWDLN